MRGFLWATLFLLLPAASAFAQFAPKVDKPAADRAAKAGADAGREGGANNRASAANSGMFAVIDVDGDGVIAKAELRKAIKALMALDADKDGNITLAEASAEAPAAGALAGPLGPGGMVDMMMQNDKDGDGKLSVDEVPPEMLPMLRNADANNDKAIDRDELTAAAATMRNQGGAPRFGAGAGPRGPFDPQQVTGQFMQFDLNRDGVLSQNEVPPQARAMLQGGDNNGDNVIDAGELQAIVNRMGDGAKRWQLGPDGRPVGRNGAQNFRRPPKDEN